MNRPPYLIQIFLGLTSIMFWLSSRIPVDALPDTISVVQKCHGHVLNLNTFPRTNAKAKDIFRILFECALQKFGLSLANASSPQGG